MVWEKLRACGTYAAVLPWQQIPTPPPTGAASPARHRKPEHRSSSHAALGNPACPWCWSQGLRAARDLNRFELILYSFHYRGSKGWKRQKDGKCVFYLFLVNKVQHTQHTQTPSMGKNQHTRIWLYQDFITPGFDYTRILPDQDLITPGFYSPVSKMPSQWAATTGLTGERNDIRLKVNWWHLDWWHRPTAGCVSLGNAQFELGYHWHLDAAFPQSRGICF